MMSTRNERFAMTPQGYIEARNWLLENGLEHMLDHEQSNDGWTVTALANKLYSESIAKKSTESLLSNRCSED